MLTRPAFLPTCDPIPRPGLPKGDRWLFEVKWDGFRVQVHKAGRAVSIFSRNGHDWTDRFPHLVAALTSLPRSAVIDGELVATDGDNVAPFWQLMRNVNRRCEDGLVVFAFDLLVDGTRDIRDMPYLERKLRLADQVARTATWRLLHSDHFSNGAGLFEECTRRELEGVVAKCKDATYRPGKSGDWVKVKTEVWKSVNRDRHEFFDRR